MKLELNNEKNKVSSSMKDLKNVLNSSRKTIHEYRAVEARKTMHEYRAVEARKTMHEYR